MSSIRAGRSNATSNRRKIPQLVVSLYTSNPLMATQTSENGPKPSSPATPPPIPSCRKKKSDDATFLEDIKDHIDEFIHASMDENKTCFQKTIKKMFGMSKIVAGKNAGVTEVESSLPFRTTVAD